MTLTICLSTITILPHRVTIHRIIITTGTTSTTARTTMNQIMEARSITSWSRCITEATTIMLVIIWDITICKGTTTTSTIIMEIIMETIMEATMEVNREDTKAHLRHKVHLLKDKRIKVNRDKTMLEERNKILVTACKIIQHLKELVLREWRTNNRSAPVARAAVAVSI
ncbi:hypothetical protein BGZ83_010157 [Gryganskiella cystojenkinii]|nr:hypothetical protein BGZ83_010157 [Gryganskiella cystojenkinii]